MQKRVGGNKAKNEERSVKNRGWRSEATRLRARVRALEKNWVCAKEKIIVKLWRC